MALTDPVRRLALPAREQREYLESIGTAPSADEFALGFDDVRPHLTGLGPVGRVDALLDEMSGPGPVWHVDALATAPQWAELRLLAVELPRVLPFDGPRPLAGSERAVLDRVLALDFPGAALLRAQTVRVLRPWYEGAPSLDVDTAGPPAPVLPVRALVHDAGTLIGEVLVRVEAGRLSAIEYACLTGEAPPPRLRRRR
ncbi:hypothetical protein V1227_23600 [Lentzea sp. DG1S-22]|uniref:hypothetical protein n=1 Tax=Lentzea sp. DG1S-22 TaxID=3108822 RepID=UPI002E76282B|nr:hypothetical protein [Lentzea sp. DG1S-22]WVH78071.1 hypothetical protein V1227_23600 [Lentzea sp. DG1S-22]